jgi:D-hexose-6-phosphate mutarotase
VSADHRLAATLPASVRLDGSGGPLPVLRINSDRHGSAEVYLHGAHLAAWQPRGRGTAIFLSRESAFDPAKPIRGGVPICFPWFGPHASDKQAPMHGFARIQPWTLTEAQDTADAIALTFLLTDSERTRATAWPHAFEATYRLTFGASLEMSLSVRNTGPSPIRFEEALHTYFAVRDVREIAISGLEHTDYLDKTDRFARKPQGPSPVRITGETDRIYLATRATCVIDDPGMGRKITIGKTGSDSTVVWNPWIERAKAIADIGDDEWVSFVCVETCNVGDAAVTLAPGAGHTLRATVMVE